ncbi:putative ribonuclease H-like domain-containing protein [Tanacetum coccineum]
MVQCDMKNIVPKESLTCLVAKATLDESMLWHRRLGHVNFKTINKLVKENLMRGLPTKCFENDQTCVACLKGKQHKASFVTDDYSRFTWVFFLATKDETSGILKSFITEVENLVDKKVKIIRCDNGTEFKNRVMSHSSKETRSSQDYILMPLWKDGSLFDSSSKNASNDEHNLLWKQERRTMKEEPKKVIQALKDPSWIEAMQEELLQFKLQQVWTLVDLPHGKRAIDTKWVYKNKKDERGIMIRNKARLVAQGYTQEEGIDYDEVFALLARIKAIRLFLALCSSKNFSIPDGCEESISIWKRLKRKFNVHQPSGFEDQSFLTKFIRSMIGSLMYLTSLRPDIIYLKVNLIGHLYPKASPIDLEANTDRDYAGASLRQKNHNKEVVHFLEAIDSWQ